MYRFVNQMQPVSSVVENERRNDGDHYLLGFGEKEFFIFYQTS